MTSLQFFLSFLSNKKRRLVFISFLAMVFQVFSLSEAFLYKVLIDNYLTRIASISSATFFRGVIIIMILWVSIAFIARLAKLSQRYFAKLLANQIGIEVFEQGYKHAINLSLDYHEVRKTGEVLRKLSKAKDDAESTIIAIFDNLIIQSVSFIIVTILFFVIRWQIALMMLCFIPIFLIISRYFSQNIGTIQDQNNIKLEKAHGSVQQALDAIMVVHSFNRQSKEVQNLQYNHQLSTEAVRDKNRVWQRFGFVQGTFINLARLTVIATSAYFVYMGQMTIGQIILLSTWSFYIFGPMLDVSELIGTVKEGLSSLGRVNDLLAVPVMINSPATPFHPTPSMLPAVSMEHVSFSYPLQSHKIIDDISFAVAPGKKVAIVGPSGAGKSTITKMILRFYDVTGGKILVGNEDIRNWDLESLRDAIGLVLQDSILFNDSIFNNIRYGKLDATKAEVISAAQRAYCHDFIVSLPEGYDTIVGDRGIKLSGGEKQRVSIARTLLKNPHILILDEATSSLDSESEVIVQQALNELSRNRTTITIAHRLSTIMNSDEILFLQNGKITERGTHDKLLALGGKYKQYIDLQKKREAFPSAN